MELRIDSGSELRIFNASLIGRLDRLASTFCTSMTGMPSTETPLTELSTRPLLSTAVIWSSLVLSMAAGFCALIVTSSEFGSCFFDLADVTPGIALICFSTAPSETRNNDFPDCCLAMSSTCDSLTHSLAPTTLMLPGSKRNTDEKRNSQTTAPKTTATTRPMSTRRTMARAPA